MFPAIKFSSIWH